MPSIGHQIAPEQGVVPCPPASVVPTLTPERRPRTASRRLSFVLTVAVPLLVFGVFFFYPVVTLVGRGLFPTGQLDLSSAGQLLGKPRFRRIIAFTLWQAAASAGLCLALGIPGAYVLYRCRFRGRNAIRALMTVPFVLPTVVVGLAFRTMFAANGPLGSWGWDGSVMAILAAHVCLNCAVVIRTVGASWARMDQRPAEAAATLGAGGIRTFLTITLPALGPAIAAAFVIVFLFCATSFGIILIIGGTHYSTIETEIYHQTVDLLNLPAASVLSVAQIVLVTVVLVVSGLLRRRTEVTLAIRPARPRRLRTGDLPAVVLTGMAVSVVVGPLVVLVVRSLRTVDGWGLANYRQLGQLGQSDVVLVPVTTALLNSLRTASLAMAISVSIGVLLSAVLSRRPMKTVARRFISAIDAVVMLPLGVSAVTVGFGFLIAFAKPPLDLQGSSVLLPIAQALVATPLVVRMLLPALRSADPRLRQAAAALGSPPFRVWRTVDLPTMGRALAGAGAFALAVSLGEFGAASFLVSPQVPTLPVEIGDLIALPSAQNAGTALAAATVLGLLCAVVVFVVDGLTGDRVGAIGGF